MNKFNVKALSTATLVAVLASVFFPATSTFGALNDAEFTRALAWGYDAGLTSYRTENAFMPLNTLTREQGARFLSQFADGVLGIEADETASCNFSDLNTADSTLKSFIVSACQQGVLKGSNNVFYPKTTMTKAQFITALVRGLDGMKDESVTPWFKNYCEWAQDNGITKETSCAGLDRPITRYEALLMLYRGAGDATVDPTDPTDPTDPVEVGNGKYTVSLSSDTPRGATLPGKAPAHVASFNVKADAAGKLANITLERIGLGNTNAIKDVTLYINGEIASRTRSFESNGTREFALTPALTLKAGETVTVDVVATIGCATTDCGTSNASNQEFAIAAIKVNGESTGIKEANKFRVGAVNATEVKITVRSNLENVRLGAKAVELADFSIKNNDRDYDVLIDAITLEDDHNNIKSNFENFVLDFDGTKVATVANVNGKTVTFVLETPVTIKRGNTEDFKVYGDVVAGVGDKTKLIIDDVKYIIGRDARYGYGLAVDGIGSNGNEVTITAGDVSVEKVKIAQNKIRQDRDDNVIAAFDLTVNAGSEVELDKLVFTKTSGTANLNDIFRNIEVSVNGSTEEVEAITAGTLEFKDLAMTLPVGKAVRIEVRGDTKVDLSAFTGSIVQLQIASNGISLEDVSENKPITDITPSLLTFDRLTVTEAKVDVSKLAASATKAVAGQKDVSFFEFQVETDSTSAVKFRGLEIQGSGTAFFNRNYVTKIALYKDGSSTPIKTWNGTDITTAGLLKLGSFTETVPASTTQKYVIKIDISSNSSLTPGTINGTVNKASFDFRDDDNNVMTLASSVMTTRNVELASAGTVTLAYDTTATTAIKNDIYMVAGSSATVASFKVSATNEDIKLVDLAVDVTGLGAADFSKIVSKVEILSDSGVVLNTRDGLVAEGQTSIAINDISYVIPANSSKTVFVRLVTNRVGYNLSDAYAAADFKVALRVVEAEGQSSNNIVTYPTTASAYNVSILPVRLSAVAITKEAELSAGATVAKFAVTADTWTNSKQNASETAQAAINSITLNASAVQFSGAQELTLRNGNSFATGAIVGGKVTFDLTAFAAADRVFSAGTTNNFYVEVSPLADLGERATLTLEYDEAKGSSITYQEADSSTPIVTGLRLATSRAGSISVKNF